MKRKFDILNVCTIFAIIISLLIVLSNCLDSGDNNVYALIFLINSLLVVVLNLLSLVTKFKEKTQNILMTLYVLSSIYYMGYFMIFFKFFPKINQIYHGIILITSIFVLISALLFGGFYFITLYEAKKLGISIDKYTEKCNNECNNVCDKNDDSLYSFEEYTDLLVKLKDFRDKKIITEEEYEVKKKQILSRIK